MYNNNFKHTVNVYCVDIYLCIGNTLISVEFQNITSKEETGVSDEDRKELAILLREAIPN